MDATTYTARREALRKAVPDGAILIMGNDEAPMNYVDNPYPFRQDSHFLYYAGVSQAGLALLIEPDGKSILYGTPDHPDDVIWFGPHPTLGDHAEAANALQANSYYLGLAYLGEKKYAQALEALSQMRPPEDAQPL